MEANKMKKYIFATILISIVLILTATSCKRSAVPDPGNIDPKGFRIDLTGEANPSTLYIPLANPAVYSDIIVYAEKNDGTPVANVKIIFEQEGYGYFEGFRVSDTRTTNGQGKAQIRYWIPAGTAIKAEVLTSIRATLIDDGRFDIPMAAVFDYIPIKIIPYQQQAVCINGKVRDTNNIGIQGIIIELSNNGGVTLTRNSGSYTICVPSGWIGTLAPTSGAGYTFTPSEYTFESPFAVDLYNYDFYAEGGPVTTIAVTPTSFTFSTAGGSSNLTVYNSGSELPIPFTISAAESWITIDGSSARSGTTEQTLIISVSASGGVTRTGYITVTADDPNVSGSPLTFSVSQNDGA